MNYVLTMDDIDDASAAGIVVCWDGKLNKPVTPVTEASTALFGVREQVESEQGGIAT